MTQETVLEQIAQLGIVPVITIDHVEQALPLADALLAGGLPVIEITFRTAAAAEVIRILARERPQLLIGAGTVLTSANLETAKASGAVFGVAPGLNPRIVTQPGRRELERHPSALQGRAGNCGQGTAALILTKFLRHSAGF
jgi:2-dehydro-3-deoxyphosphogluconate aldolase/(4S)-4-hydroxy-2-oxoglutarate aldolase